MVLLLILDRKTKINKMKRKIQFMTTLVVFTLFVACDSQPSSKTNDSKTEKADETSCIYSIVEDSTAVNWTAFKTNDRIGVGGHFDEIKVWIPDNAKSPKEVLISTSFDIITASVNSGNDERDPKLVKYFFSTLADGHIIKGQIVSADGKDNAGEGTVKLFFNGITKKIPYTYQIKENKIYLKTGINLDEWDGSAAVKSLNTECYDLHTGKDGESKLWPDVEIEVVALLKKKC
jgi:hypothetical protein